MKFTEPLPASSKTNSNRGRSLAVILITGLELICGVMLVLSMRSLFKPTWAEQKLAELQNQVATNPVGIASVNETTDNKPATEAQEIAGSTQPISNGAAIANETTNQSSEKPKTEPAKDKTVSELDMVLSSVFGQLPAVAESPYPTSQELVDLGRMLYFDTRLSTDGTKSCNSCHDLNTYGVDGVARSIGVMGVPIARNSPTVYNAALHISQFWDGRSPDVEDQATKPIMAAGEMGMIDEKEVKRNVTSIPGYIPMFEAAFPADPDPINLKNVGMAIGAFERGLITPSRFDRFLAGDRTQLNEQEQKGLATFISLRCVTCHMGPTVGGLNYKRLGEKEPYPSEDLGRYEVTKLEEDKYVFKVPSLRNVAETGPYLHDGSIETLDEMVRLMARYQLGKEVNDGQVSDVVAFLKSLTGDVPTEYIAEPKLPPSAPVNDEQISLIDSTLE